MKELDFTNIDLIDRYYRTEFTYDISNYFIVNDWQPMRHSEPKTVTCDSTVEHLYKRTEWTFDSDPAIYMGAGPWWNIHQNFEFCGMFAYMFITDRCIRKGCGDEEAFRFCKEFTFPLFHDTQPIEAFDVIAVLKEASLAPVSAEVTSYLNMLDNVIPYMKEITEEFLSKLPCAVQEEIDQHIQYLYDWVRNNKDEELYLFGKLKVRKEYMPEGSDYPARYYLLESLKWVLDRYGVCSFDEMKEADMYKRPWTSAYIDSFDGPVIPHYADLEFMKEHDSRPVPDNPLEYKETSEEEEKEHRLYNLLLNLYWDDIPFEKDGHVGLKDCWGRVIVPAEYEDCDGTWHWNKFANEESCIAVKRNGKWALTVRNQYKHLLSDYKFDSIKIIFSGLYVTSIDGKYGLCNRNGKELLPAEMDDIYEPTCDGHIVYKKGTKYGIRLNGGKFTELCDELDLDCGYFLMVRIGNQWGYIDGDGCFVTKRSLAKMTTISHLESVNRTYEVPEIDDVNEIPEGYMTLDDFRNNLERHFWRFSTKANLKDSSLDGKADVSMGIDKRVLYYKLLPSGITFCMDMERPYQMKLLDDRYHDMPQSWEGYQQEKALLQQWLNERNARTGVRNWAELAYSYCICPRNEGRPFKISYAPRKTIKVNDIDFADYEDFDFPEIKF